MFRFVILGAAKIGRKFCDAVKLTEDAEVVAVASKSAERAEAFAKENGVRRAYDSYEAMLDKEKPDCAYIAVTPNDHARLTRICIDRGIPVLCEKAMFVTAEEAESTLAYAKDRNVFCMEALWSRFLPANHKAREWLLQGKIGTPKLSRFGIGFRAPDDNTCRFLSSTLAGGCTTDITVYAWMLTTFFLGKDYRGIKVSALKGGDNVDVVNQITLEYENTLATLSATFASSIDEEMVIWGTEGKLYIPRPHFARECFLYDAGGILTENFTDEKTINGFTWEIAETIRCIKAGLIESKTVPWEDTIDCAGVFDQVRKCIGIG